MYNEFVVRRGVYLKDKNSTYIIIENIYYVLCLICAITYFNKSIETFKITRNFYSMFTTALIFLIPIILTYIINYLWYLLRKDKKYMHELFYDKAIIIPSLIIGILAGPNTNLVILAITITIMTLVRLIFKGYFNLKINSIIIDLLLLIISSSILGYSYTLFSINYILCLICFVYLVITKSIKYKISIFYIISLFILIFTFNYFNITYVNIFHILNNTLFMIIFISSDMVSSPLTTKNQIIYGIVLGIVIAVIYILGYNQIIMLSSLLIINIIYYVLNKYIL